MRWITAHVERVGVDLRKVVDFWCKVSGSSLSAWHGRDPKFAELLPLDGSHAHLRFQGAESGFSGSHLDLHVADVQVSANACVGLGATVVVGDSDRSVFLVSPGGMGFRVVAHQGEHQRQVPVVSGGGGMATLVDQVSVDVDPARFSAEVQFWSTVTGWSTVPARAAEFVPLDTPPTMPLRVMLQRRTAPSGPTSCHLDLACTDLEAAVTAHEALEAKAIATRRYWTVMTDPSGTEYCLTRRSPTTGMLPPEPEADQ